MANQEGSGIMPGPCPTPNAGVQQVISDHRIARANAPENFAEFFDEYLIARAPCATQEINITMLPKPIANSYMVHV